MSARPVTSAIAGLGMTPMGKIYGKSAAELAVDAICLAADDAGITMGEIDGLLVNSGVGGDIGMQLQFSLQMRNLGMLTAVQAFGSSAGAMVQYATLAIEAGMVDTVVCVFADAPLTQGKGSSGAYGGAGRSLTGIGALPTAAGLRSAPAKYAMAARRHMEAYGTTSEQFGAVAIAARAWAEMNPLAQMRDPMTLEDHQASRVIADPLRLLDCCLVSNGAVAVIVTSAERARDLAQPPVYVRGWGQGHPGYIQARGSDFGLSTGAKTSGPAALRMAGIELEDIDIAEIYDCFTYTTLVTLEDYGFCEKGEGGKFVESGALAPGGSLPTNTGGGELSGYYMWGMTPLSEAVIQARGQAGERQVDSHDHVLVSGNGGVLDFHSSLVLSPRPTNN
ncbi:thiolase family protein [Rhodococcus sp. KBS0724]|jgi:acetyl-CoA acetyltransferase|uniref:thiolase family protein n=1 Tax=Rhodococcus sp. KBS0724 TaxID=1179674 RepID=UPI00110E4CA1|nr:thiolase family protein [Rhodococcus sp. KBS0724]TSD49419.1 thiolase family protein [Rhodococcus sp. KBS0724]